MGLVCKVKGLISLLGSVGQQITNLSADRLFISIQFRHRNPVNQFVQEEEQNNEKKPFVLLVFVNLSLWFIYSHISFAAAANYEFTIYWLTALLHQHFSTHWPVIELSITIIILWNIQVTSTIIISYLHVTLFVMTRLMGLSPNRRHLNKLPPPTGVLSPESGWCPTSTLIYYFICSLYNNII